MADQRSEILASTKEFVLEEFLPGESSEQLTPTTPLISGGILDSISIVRLIGFLEERHGVEFAAFEISEDHLDTLDRIAALVASKKSGG